MDIPFTAQAGVSYQVWLRMRAAGDSYANDSVYLQFSGALVDALFERVAASGAEVLQEPMDQPYGVRDCSFRDPSGNQVRFNQKSKD